MQHYLVTGISHFIDKLLHPSVNAYTFYSLDENIKYFETHDICFLCSCHHELETARLNGLLGNIDANTGDPQTGMEWLLKFCTKLSL